MEFAAHQEHHSSLPLSDESWIAVRRQQTFLEIILGSTCWRGGITCLASGHHLRRPIIHASAVSWSKFRMLTRWNRVRSSGCGLHNMPHHFQIAPAFGAGSSCEFPGFVFDVLFIFLVFYVMLRLSCPICQHNLRNLSVLSGNDVLQCRTLGFLDLSDLVATRRHCKTLKRIITFPGGPFNMFVFSILLCVFSKLRTGSSRGRTFALRGQ